MKYQITINGQVFDSDKIEEILLEGYREAWLISRNEESDIKTLFQQQVEEVEQLRRENQALWESRAELVEQVEKYKYSSDSFSKSLTEAEDLGDALQLLDGYYAVVDNGKWCLCYGDTTDLHFDTTGELIDYLVKEMKNEREVEKVSGITDSGTEDSSSEGYSISPETQEVS